MVKFLGRSKKTPESLVEAAQQQELDTEAQKVLSLIFMRHANVADIDLGEWERTRSSVELLGNYLLERMPDGPEVIVRSTFTKRTAETARFIGSQLNEIGINAIMPPRLWRPEFEPSQFLLSGEAAEIRALSQEHPNVLLVCHEDTPSSLGQEFLLHNYTEVVAVENGQVRHIAPGYH